MMFVAPLTVNDVAWCEPKSTWLALLKPVPEIVTLMPLVL